MSDDTKKPTHDELLDMVNGDGWTVKVFAQALNGQPKIAEVPFALTPPKASEKVQPQSTLFGPEATACFACWTPFIPCEHCGKHKFCVGCDLCRACRKDGHGRTC